MSADGPATNPPGEISSLDWYRLFRSRIEYEGNLIVQRLSWLVTSQAFLFTAYAITTSGLSNLASKSANVYLEQEALLFRLIPLVAISNALLIYCGILGALKAIRELRRAYRVKAIPQEEPLIQTSTEARLLGIAAPLVLPLLFVAVWSVLLINSLR
jgi:hypothetical protein